MSLMIKKKKDTRYSKWTIKELLQECETNGLDASDCETKAEIIDLLIKTSTNDNPTAVTKKTTIQPLASPQSHNATESTQESETTLKKNNLKASTLPSGFTISHVQAYNQNLSPSTTMVLPRFAITTTIPVKSATEKAFIVSFLYKIWHKNPNID